jgi:hypothetical protein
MGRPTDLSAVWPFIVQSVRRSLRLSSSRGPLNAWALLEAFTAHTLGAAAPTLPASTSARYSGLTTASIGSTLPGWATVCGAGPVPAALAASLARRSRSSRSARSKPSSSSTPPQPREKQPACLPAWLDVLRSETTRAGREGQDAAGKDKREGLKGRPTYARRTRRRGQSSSR